MIPGWEHFEHQADIGVRGRGRTEAEAFEQAALALMAVSVDPARVAGTERVDVRCEAPDLELLLVDWLSRLVYEMSARRLIFGKFSVRIDGCRLVGSAWGERADSARHEPAVEVKGVSYLALRVGTDPDGGWVAQCVVDV